MTATAAVIRFGLAAGASAAELEHKLRLERGVSQIDDVARLSIALKLVLEPLGAVQAGAELGLQALDLLAQMQRFLCFLRRANLSRFQV